VREAPSTNSSAAVATANRATTHAGAATGVTAAHPGATATVTAAAHPGATAAATREGWRDAKRDCERDRQDFFAKSPSHWSAPQ